MISSLLNIAYLIPIPIRAFMAPDSQSQSLYTDAPASSAAIKEAPMLCVVPLCITAIGSIVLFFVADWIYEVLLPITMKA
jgi:multicomponent Na+:H+ antiporter subunit D